MDPLELTLDEWRTLSNAIFWHKQQAEGAEKERIEKIDEWMTNAIQNMSVDTIRLETVGDK